MVLAILSVFSPQNGHNFTVLDILGAKLLTSAQSWVSLDEIILKDFIFIYEHLKLATFETGNKIAHKK